MQMKGKINFLVIILTLLISFKSTATEAGIDCCTSKSPTVKAATEISEVSQCLATKESSECRRIYSELKEHGEKPENYLLQCQKKISQDKLSESAVWGCAVGAFDSVFGEAGRAIGESLGWMNSEVNFRKECNKSIEYKRRLFAVYNQSVDKTLRIVTPDDAVLKAYDCVDLRRNIFEQNRNLQNEKNRLSGATYRKPDLNLLTAAKNSLHQIGVRYECYSPRRSAQMICAGLAMVGAFSLPPAGYLARISKISGLPETKLKNRIETIGRVSVAKTAMADTAKVVSRLCSTCPERELIIGERLAKHIKDDHVVAPSDEYKELVRIVDTRKLSKDEKHLALPFAREGTNTTYFPAGSTEKDVLRELERRLGDKNAEWIPIEQTPEQIKKSRNNPNTDLFEGRIELSHNGATDRVKVKIAICRQTPPPENPCQPGEIVTVMPICSELGLLFVRSKRDVMAPGNSGLIVKPQKCTM
jgi:hypothetical protein